MSNLYILNDLLTNGYMFSLVNFISIFSIISGISVIVAKNPIVSVLFLIALFFNIALYLMTLGINFIGLSYLLVYVGAVSILFLFILMLINVRISELTTENNNSLVLALIVGILLLIPIFNKGTYNNMMAKEDNIHYSYTNVKSIGNSNLNMEIYDSSLSNKPLTLVDDLTHSLDNIFSYLPLSNNENDILFVTSNLWDGALAEVSHITSIGNIIYTNYPLWLILTSIILLLSMVGAIVITIKQ